MGANLNWNNFFPWDFWGLCAGVLCEHPRNFPKNFSFLYFYKLNLNASGLHIWMSSMHTAYVKLMRHHVLTKSPALKHHRDGTINQSPIKFRIFDIDHPTYIVHGNENKLWKVNYKNTVLKKNDSDYFFTGMYTILIFNWVDVSCETFGKYECFLSSTYSWGSDVATSTPRWWGKGILAQNSSGSVVKTRTHPWS